MENPLNHWVGGIIHNTVQNCYAFQYITMCLSGYINSPTVPDFLDLKHGMEYLMNHPHGPIMYSINKIYKTQKSPHQCFFKSGDAEIKKNQEYPNFLHTNCDADNARDLSYRR